MVNDTFVFMPYLCDRFLSSGWQMNLRWAEYATPHTGWTDSLLPDGYSDFARLHELCWLLTFTPVRAHIFYIPNDTKWKVPFEIWHTQLNLPINPIPFKPSKKNPPTKPTLQNHPMPNFKKNWASKSLHNDFG